MRDTKNLKEDNNGVELQARAKLPASLLLTLFLGGGGVGLAGWISGGIDSAHVRVALDECRSDLYRDEARIMAWQDWAIDTTESLRPIQRVEARNRAPEEISWARRDY